MKTICVAPLLFLTSLSGCGDKVAAEDPLPVDPHAVGIDAAAAETSLAPPEKEVEDQKMQSPVAFD